MACKRVHVERAIGLSEIYRILTTPMAMATVDNRFDINAEKNGSSAKSDAEMSFKIDDLVGEAVCCWVSSCRQCGQSCFTR